MRGAVIDVDMGFAEDCMAVVIAKLSDGYQGVLRETWYDVGCCSGCWEIWQRECACVGGGDGAAVRESDGDWMLSWMAISVWRCVQDVVSSGTRVGNSVC